ncbi:MAG: GNAT family N-acetyltransferase [Eubacteriales bacterium]
MLEKMQVADFDQVNQLIEENFPPHEIRGYEAQKNLINNPSFHIFVLKDLDSHQLKGFISVWDVDDFWFVDHFAVSETYRNQGLGGHILTALQEISQGKIFLEVDLPETEIAKRRIGFYERNGYVTNPYPYQLPALVSGGNIMNLMIMSWNTPLPLEKFTSLKNQLFKIAYNQ